MQLCARQGFLFIDWFSGIFNSIAFGKSWQSLSVPPVGMVA